MDLGIQTPPEHTDFARLVDLWQAADELGFRAAFTFDHFVPLNPGARPGLPGGVPDGPQLEGWTTLAALAMCTRRLEVGSLVTGVTYRHPVILAKMAVTLDHISDGRAVLGVGAAWHEAEHAMYGFDYPGVGDRMSLLDETVEVFKMLCSAESPVTHQGRFVKLDQAVFEPKPLRPGGIPVLIGGGGERLRRIAARRADWYNGFWAPWEWSEVNEKLDRLVETASRLPGDLLRTAFLFCELSGSTEVEEQLVTTFQNNRGGTEEEVRARVLVGDPERMIRVLQSYDEAGVELAILNLRPGQDVEDLVNFGEQVLPAIRGS